MPKPEEIVASASTLGEAIRLLREAQGLTLRELASRVDVSAPFLSDLEHNRRSTDKLAEIAKALGIEFDLIKRLDGRVSTDLKEWMATHPELGSFLEDYRRSGKPVDQLLKSLRAGTSRTKPR